MKAIALIVGLLLVGSVAAYALLGGGNRDAGGAQPEVVSVDVTGEEPIELEIPEMIEPADEPEMIDFDPFFADKNMKAPSRDELSYDNPIVQWHPDRSITVHKLARLTLADGTVKEFPVQLKARLAKGPMEVRNASEKVQQYRLDRNDPDFGKPLKPDIAPDTPLNQPVGGDSDDD